LHGRVAGPAGETQLTTPAQAVALLRSRAYLRLLVVAGLLGVPVSAFAWGFLAAASKLQHWLFISLPSELGLGHAPAWWPFPILAVGGLSAAMAIRFLPGTGGHEPADGFKAGGRPFTPGEIPGILLAALATLGFGAVLGPEAPLIALGGALSVWAVSRARAAAQPQAKVMIAAAGSFAAVSALLGSPLASAFLLMEAAGLGGMTLELVLLPGLLAAGLGTLIFVGLGEWSGLGTFSLAITGLPHFGRPNVAELGWSVVIGLAAAALCVATRRGAVLLRNVVRRQPLLLTPAAGLVVAAAAVIFGQATGKDANTVLFSGQNSLSPLIAHAAGYGLGALVLLAVFKTIGYSASLSGFRGGPTFPALFIGAVGGAAMSHLPGLPLVPAVGMGMAAMTAGMLRLPMTAVLITALLVSSDALAVTPLAIVAVIVAYMVVTWLDPLAASSSTPGSAGPGGAAPGERSSDAEPGSG
jgi:H+/Cl- antiporter ClcA